jgi:hypothetical protein
VRLNSVGYDVRWPLDPRFRGDDNGPVLLKRGARRIIT